MDKSYVAMEKKVCIICGELYNTDAILLDRRLKKSLEDPTVTGRGICPAHEKLHNNGYVALVEVDPSKSKFPNDNTKKVNQEDVYRTGRIAHVRREVAKELFNLPEDALDGPMVFTEKAVLDQLAANIPEDSKPN